MLGHECVRKAEEDKGSLPYFINTYMGGKFWYNHLEGNVIEIVDIAHALSQLCRYTGHTDMFWSVAQHSLLVAEKMPGTPEQKLVALLHDAAEAYTGDLSSPLKAYLREATYDNGGIDFYGYLQDRITAVIYNQYGVTQIPEDVRLYDRAACLFEAEGFMGLPAERLQKDGFPMELRGLWQPWDPKDFAATNSDRDHELVETEFLARFEDLMHACKRSDLI